jgi:predicted ATPase
VLSKSLASAKLLLLTNYRPEYRHEWGQKTYYTQLRLAPFGKEEAEEFLDVLLGESPRPVGERDRVRGSDNNLQTLKQLILDKTQGTPFFMEEVVQTLAEDGTLTGTPGHYQLTHHAATQHGLTLQIPPTVQGILAARIDRLAPGEKALLQQLAVIGRQFPLSLIRQVITQPEVELYRLLASLQRKEFLYEQPAFPESEYLFKHALTQEVAYGTVLQEQKKLLHERTGQAIEQLYQDKLAERYDDLAHHYQRSGNAEKAIEYLQLAGQQAARRSAYEEALAYLDAALKLLLVLPDSAAHAPKELSLQVALGASLMATKGFSAAEVRLAYTRAHELCSQLGDTSQLFRILGGLWNFYYLQGEFLKSREMETQLLALAREQQDSGLLAEAQRAMAVTLQSQGEVARARTLLEQSLVLLRSLPKNVSPVLNSLDPTMGCLAQLARGLWFLGYPDSASAKVHEALNRAQEFGQPFSIAFATMAVTMVSQYRRDEAGAQQYVTRLAALVIEHGFPTFSAWSASLSGWAIVQCERKREGLKQIQEGLSIYQTIGSETHQSYFLSLFADACLSLGCPEEGLVAVNEALEKIEKFGERFHEAELYRLKGELTLQQENQKAKGKSLS